MWKVIILSGVCFHVIGVMSVPMWKKQRSTSMAPDMTDESYRLPKNFIPYKYDLQIEPHMYGDDQSEFSFSGNVKILIKCQISANNITLHNNNLKFNRVNVWEFGSGKSYAVVDTIHQTEKQFVSFTVNETLSRGKLYFIEISFTGPLTVDNRGLYLSYYYQPYPEKHYLATTQMEPTDARKMFPCFDEPQLKAVFNISIVRREGWTALTNGRRFTSMQISDNRYIDYFESTPKMSTYLVAIVVSKFKYTSTKTERGSEFNVWAKPEDVNKTHLALYDGAAMQTFFEDYLELDYPLPKQDMIEVPHFSFGAMENWGLIIYRRYYLTYDPSSPALYWKKTVIETVAHELAHQWFGNIVTLHWWSDVWLNEGFANIMQYKGSGFRYPDWNQYDHMLENSVRGAKSSDVYTSTVPMHNPVTTRSEIMGMFGSTSYNKGGAVLRMMEHFMGRETFRRGLVLYMKQHKYGNTYPDDLWHAMGNVSTLNIKEIMDTWVYQSNFPVVTVKQDDDGRLHLSQKRFVMNRYGSEDDDAYPPPNGYIWSIPFTYTTSSEKDFNKTSSDIIWFDQEEMVIDTPSRKKDVWIVANIQDNGFYRVNYTEDNWIQLADQLRTDLDAIHPINRAALIDDSRALSYAGELDQKIVNMIWEASSTENDIAPLSAAVSGYRQTDSILSDTKAKDKFRSFVKESVGKQYDKYGLASSPDNMPAIERRKIIVEAACDFGVDACTRKAVEMYRNWMNGGRGQSISSDIQKAVICTAISEGGTEEWNFAFERYKTSSLTAERINLLEGMACSKSSSILHRYLELSLNPDEIPLVDAIKAIDAVSKNPVGRKIVWRFLNDNWDTIKERFGKDGLPLEELLSELSKSFHTDDDLRQMESFKMAHKNDMGSAELPLKQDLERTEANMRWMKNNYQVVEEWLDRR